MCGLFVVKGKIANTNQVIKMLENIKYRGPDNSSVFSDKDVVVGHNRLKILDLSDDSNQPMHSKCGRYIIAYNGEIYNFKSLSNELNKNGHYDSGKSDTETLFNFLFQYGLEKTISKIDGMYAFAFFDTSSAFFRKL